MTVAGTVGFDDLTTPAGRTPSVPGGSALYFTLAARRHCQVHSVAVLGSDGAPLAAILAKAGADPSGIATREGPSYRWRAVHPASGGVPSSEQQHLGVYAGWRPLVPAAARRSRILFLGSMAPGSQRLVLDQCPGADLVGLDTMRDFIRSDRDQLGELLERVDLLFANQAELEQLTGRVAALEAARSLLGRRRLVSVVVKLGAAGVVLVGRSQERTFAAHPAPAVIDPTGAGDALAGGLLGRLAALRRTDWDAISTAMEDGLAAAAAAISDFGVAGLEATPPARKGAPVRTRTSREPS